MGRIRVFLLDDHDVVRQGLRRVLADAANIEIVGEASTARQGADAILELRPDVAVIDVRLPDGNGIDVARHVRSHLSSVHCVMFTAVSGEDAFLKSVIAGAVGYIPKDAEGTEVIEAIERVAAGHSLIDPSMLDRLRRREIPQASFDGVLGELTPHERRILDLVAEGQTNREIAERLQLAEKTIRNYVSSILGKVGARNRTQLAVYVANLMSNSHG